MSSENPIAELAETSSISPGDVLQAVVTVEDDAVSSSVRGRRVTYPNLSGATLESSNFGHELTDGEPIGLKCIVRKVIYGPSETVNSIFVAEVLELFEPEESETRGCSRAESAPNQNLGRSINYSAFGTDPEMMRGLVQGKL